MPTTAFASVNAAIVFSGQWSDGVFGSHNGKQLIGSCSEIDVVATGTQLTLMSYIDSAATIQISIDGGAWTTIAATTNTWASQTLFTGLSDTAHAVGIRAVGAPSWWVDRDALFSVTGGSPGVSFPTGFGTQYPLSDTTFAANSQQEGGWIAGNLGFYTTPQSKSTPYADTSVTFTAQCASIKVWMLLDGTKIDVQRDGVDIGTITVPNSAPQMGWVTVATGLDATMPHRYTLTVCFVPSNTLVYAVMPVGGVGLVMKSYSVRSALVVTGDSIVRAEVGTGSNAMQGFAHLLGTTRNMAVDNKGVASSTVHQFGSGIAPVTTQAGEAAGRMTELTGISPAPQTVVLLYGTNDMAQGGGAETTAAFQTSYQAMLTTLASGLPTSKLLCLGILPRKDFNAAARASWSTAIQAAITALANSRITFVGMEGVVDDSAGSADLFDNVHPNAGGYTKIANYLLPFIGLPLLSDLNIGREAAMDDAVIETGGAG